MVYSIGDVSKILNVSKEMIRYYEKQGALKPARQEENNYRSYSTMDLFFLMEMLRYQAMGLNTKEINQLLYNDYMHHYSDYLMNYSSQLENEIRYKMILKDRIKEMAERANTSQLNLNKYWYKEIPSHSLAFLCLGKDDLYETIQLKKEHRDIMFKGQNFTFFESLVLFKEENEEWYYGINEQYKKNLDIELNNFLYLEKKICLCTMIDMGEVGEFNRNKLQPLFDYMKENQLIIDGDIRGVIICRGYQNHKYQRIMEIQVPIKP